MPVDSKQSFINLLAFECIMDEVTVWTGDAYANANQSSRFDGERACDFEWLRHGHSIIAASGQTGRGLESDNASGG